MHHSVTYSLSILNKVQFQYAVFTIIIIDHLSRIAPIPVSSN